MVCPTRTKLMTDTPTPTPSDPDLPPPAPSRWAVAALVTGILGLPIPLINLAAVIIGVIALRKTRDPAVGGKKMAVAGITLGVISIIAGTALMVMMMSTINDQAHRLRCEANLQKISMNLMVYAQDNRGWLPPNFETLVRATDMSLDAFVCPGSKQTVGKTPADADNPAHNSYVYVPEKSIKLFPGSYPVLIHERPGAHRGGLYFLFGDGHAEFCSTREADQLLDDLAAKRAPTHPAPVYPPIPPPPINGQPR